MFIMMNTLDRLADYNKACNVALDDNEDCMQDQFVILGSTQQEEGYVYNEYDESVLEHEEGHYNHHHQQHYNDMSLTGIVFLIVLAVALGVCAVFLYKFHNLHHQQQQQQQEQVTAAGEDDGALQATETTTKTTETVAASTATVESSETKKNNTNDNKDEKSATSPLPQQQQQHQQQPNIIEDDEEPDLVVEEDSSISNDISNGAAIRQSKRVPEKQQTRPRHQPQQQPPIITVVPSTTVPTSSQLTAAPTSAVARTAVDDDVPDEEVLTTIKAAAEKVLLVAKHLEQRTGETLSLDKVFEQSMDQHRHDEKMRFKMQSEVRHFEFETHRETFKNEQTQARHDEKMATKNQDDAWLCKIKTCRSQMLQTLMQEFLYTTYAFFAIHVFWHFFRLRQIWTFAGITSALYYSVCGGGSGGQCGTPNDLTFHYDEDETSSPSSYLTSYVFSSDGYFSYYFSSLSSSWSSFSLLELVAPTWLLQALACTGICGVKIMFGVFGAMVTVVIVPGWMQQYMAAGVVAMTLLSNVFEWVPFIIHWQYMAGIYSCLGLGCYYYIERVCQKSQGALQQHANGGTTPSKLQVTTEMAKLDNVKEALQKHKFLLLGLAVVCFHYSALELERKRQFAY